MTYSNELLTEIQAADIFQCQKSTLSFWRCKNRGPKFIKIGNLIRYRPEDIHEFIASRQVQTSA